MGSLLSAATEVPGGEDNGHDGCSAAEQRHSPCVEAGQGEAWLRRRRRRRSAGRDPRVQLRDEELAVEAEKVSVGAKESSGVGLRRQLVEPLPFERGEVLRTDSRRLRGILQLKPLTRPRLLEGDADFEQRACPLVASHIVPARQVSRAGNRGKQRSMFRRPSLLGIVWLIIGVAIAADRDYLQKLDTVRRIASAVLAILLWPLLLLGIDLHIKK